MFLHYWRRLRMMAATARPWVIFVLGGPGAGKGTQCANIVREFGYVHLSAGELLREEASSGSDVGQRIEDDMRNGRIVPVAITIGLLRKAMDASQTKKFLIDGFPRNEDNLSGWNKEMEGVADVKCVLFFDCSQQVCMDRALGRGRSDDNIVSFEKRYNTYQTQTMHIIEHYQEKGLVRRIDSAPPPNQVFAEVKKVIEELV